MSGKSADKGGKIESLCRNYEKEYKSTNWIMIKKGQPRLQTLTKKTKLSEDEKFLKKFLEELGSEPGERLRAPSPARGGGAPSPARGGRAGAPRSLSTAQE